MDQEGPFYTGIGARLTPSPMITTFKRWGYRLGYLGITLRSGAAHGADTAFENGCDQANGKKEIYLPWKNFNGSDSSWYNIPIEAFEIAGDIYGSTWKHAKQSTQKFMARNMMQVMGFGLNEPSKFVLCWTPDGCTTRRSRTKETGGTGQAIAYAYEMDIPIFNFKNRHGEEEFIDFFFAHLDIYGIELK